MIDGFVDLLVTVNAQKELIDSILFANAINSAVWQRSDELWEELARLDAKASHALPKRLRDPPYFPPYL